MLSSSTECSTLGGKSKARIIAEMLAESKTGLVKIIFDHTLQEASFYSEAQFTNSVTELKNLLGEVKSYVVCIGGENGYARFKTSSYLDKLGLKPITLIHNKSFIEPTASIGVGCQIMPCAVIHKFVTIGSHTIVNTNATVDHECIIGNGVHIMGNAAITGNVVIEDYATVGTNATILPFVKVGKGAFIGAGALVSKDVPPYTVVAGVPSKFIRKNELVFFEDNLIKLIN